MKQANHKKTNIVLFHLNEVTRIVKFTETESRIAAVKRLGEERIGELLLNGYRTSLLQHDKIMMVAQQYNVLNATKLISGYNNEFCVHFTQQKN